MTDSGVHVVLGASGGIGSAMVRHLASTGRRVRAVSRHSVADPPAGVEQLALDVGTPDGATRACAGASVVYYCAAPNYAKWPELFPPMTDAVIAGAAAAGAKIVLADNLYTYGPVDAPMTEQTPTRAHGRKGRTRIAMADALLAADAAGTVRCAIGRASDYYGPSGITSAAGATVLRPAIAGKQARWLGSLDQPHTLNYLDDIARALTVLGDRAEADGGIWHLPAAEPLTGRQFLELVFAAAGHPARIGTVPRALVRVGGLVNATVRELNETLYQFEAPFVSDASKFQAAFGPFTPTPHPDAVRTTVKWFQRFDGTTK